jgi:hypothetical protein
MRKPTANQAAKLDIEQSKKDATYQAAREVAQKKANDYGFDFGLEWLGGGLAGWHTFMLPGKSFRQGHETRCEVVMCEDLSKRQPGHGP